MLDVLVRNLAPSIDLANEGTYRFLINSFEDLEEAVSTFTSPEGYVEGHEIDRRVYFIDGRWLFQWIAHSGDDSESWHTLGFIESVS